MSASYRISNVWPQILGGASEGIKLGVPAWAIPGTGLGVALGLQFKQLSLSPRVVLGD